MRPLLLVVLLPAVAGCGGSTRPAARPQTIAIGERFRCGGLTIAVDSLELGHGSWRVSASVRNDSGSAIEIGRPHSARGTYFGLARPGVAHPGLRARRFAPPLPRRLEPGEQWRGSFSGRGAIAPASPVRVVLGRFSRAGSVLGFDCATDRSVHPR